MSNAIRLGLATVVSIVILLAIFRGVDLGAIWNTCENIALGPLFLYAFALAVTQAARAVRWGILTRPVARLTPRLLWRVSNIGNMLIMLLPLRLGELSRPYLMRKYTGAPLSAGMGAALVERVLDGLLVTLLFFVTTACLGEQYRVSKALWTGAVVALLIFAGALTVIVVTLLSGNWVPKIIRRILHPVSDVLATRLISMLEGFIQGMRALPDVGCILGVIFWTLLYWAANATGLWWLMQAFGWPLPLIAGFSVVCVLVIGIMIPAGPGLLGTYQAALIAGLATFGIGRADALAFSVVAYLVNLGVLVGFGLPHVLRGDGHIQIEDMWAQHDTVEA